MPKSSKKHAIARQWATLKAVPSKPTGRTVQEILDLLEQQGYEVDKRTVQRDLASLAEQYWVCHDGGSPYRWQRTTGTRLPVEGLSMDEALTLHLVEKTATKLLPAAVMRHMSGIFAMARSTVGTTKTKNPIARWSEKVAYIEQGMQGIVPPQIAPGILEAVQQALMHEHQVKITWTGHDGKLRDRTVSPLAFIVVGVVPYLVVAEEGRDTIQVPLHRMKSVKPLIEKTKAPASYKGLEDYIASGKAEFGKADPVQLRAWVSPILGKSLKDTMLAPNQKLTPYKGSEMGTADPGFILEVVVRDTWRLEGWLLSKASDIVVLSPDDLRQRLATRWAMALQQLELSQHLADRGAQHLAPLQTSKAATLVNSSSRRGQSKRT